MKTENTNQTENKFDVVMMGGGLAASTLAISLLRARPQTRIAIIEQSEVFPKKVGESTSDVTALFLNRFGIPEILSKQQRKTGLRFMVHDQETRRMDQASDFSSPSVLSIANGYQLNRSTFDQALLDEAERLGALIFRPARVTEYHYQPFQSSVSLECTSGKKTLLATWLVDASGRAGLVANKMNWRKQSTTLNTASSWAHFTNVPMISKLDNHHSSEWEQKAIGDRHFATTHFMGEGYWVWTIPLSDDSVSIGIVYDKDILKTEAHPKDFFFEFLKNHPSLSALTDHSEAKNFRHYPHLPYTSEKYFEPGMILVGDAAAFVDPLFSPGMELTCQQILWLAPLITQHLESGKYCEKSWKKYGKVFTRGFSDRIIIYESRYQLMGDYELFALLTQLDFAGYYTYLIHPSAMIPSLLKFPARFIKPLKIFYRAYKSRLITLAKRRKELGLTAKGNHGNLSFSYARVPSGFALLYYGHFLSLLWLGRYLRLELKHLFLPYTQKSPGLLKNES